jgi:hypothetical protein
MRDATSRHIFFDPAVDSRYEGAVKSSGLAHWPDATERQAFPHGGRCPAAGEGAQDDSGNIDNKTEQT